MMPTHSNAVTRALSTSSSSENRAVAGKVQVAGRWRREQLQAQA